MDDDESGGSGISGAAGYLLGYMAAEGDQAARLNSIPTHRWKGGRRPYDAHDVESAIATWKAAVARRDAANAQLQTQLLEASAHNASMRDHSAELANENVALRDLVTKLEHDISLMQDSIGRLVAFHEKELNGLRAEVARHKGKG